MDDGLIAKQILEKHAQVGSLAFGGADTFEANEGYDIPFLEPQDIEAGDISDALGATRVIIVAEDALLPSGVRISEVLKTLLWGSLSESEAISTSDIQESNVTFDQSPDDLSEVQRERAQINARLQEASVDLPTATFVRLQQRFRYLFEPDDGETVRIAPGSVGQLLKFLRKNPKLRCPSIVITTRRNVKAIWRASEKELFWIEFEPNGDVTFLAFSPNAKRSDGVERGWNLSTVSDVLLRSKQVGALRWMQR